MEELNICPSTLAEGFNTYSPTALRLMFDGREVSHVLTFDSPNNDESNDNDYSSLQVWKSHGDWRNECTHR